MLNGIVGTLGHDDGLTGEEYKVDYGCIMGVLGWWEGWVGESVGACFCVKKYGDL